MRGECLDYAIRIREPHGIWGGLNEVERKMVLDRRALTRPAVVPSATPTPCPAACCGAPPGLTIAPPV